MFSEQFLLLKLAEECNEVAQRAIKQVQFGQSEIQKDQPLTNGERLKSELLDLMSVVAMLTEVQEIPLINKSELQIAYLTKKKKLQKYLDYSAQLGRIPEIRL